MSSMNDDFRDLFSTQGARVDNDGIAPGDNLWGAPDPGFSSTEVDTQSEPQSIRSTLQTSVPEVRQFVRACAIAVGVAVIVLAFVLMLLR